ncbi:hypothetical protein JTE90_003844 [Oedothorax gibbosus]|uniref:Uncharacterized protein n=1 Tax=Oedothorax gibbosus TaxID=931172 RepID=A0AAV6TFD2_9ARAC|nr:hypothetical protein JTE90_003844 [Oedothorax gibbosus]
MRLNSNERQYPEGNTSDGNQLLDGSIVLRRHRPRSTIDLKVRKRYGLHQEVSLASSSWSGNSSPSFGSHQRVRAFQTSANSTSGTRRVSVAPARDGNGYPECGDSDGRTFISPRAYQDPLNSRKM